MLVPQGDPVQLGENVRARVYVTVDGQKQLSENRVVLPEGWWCLPDPGDGAD